MKRWQELLAIAVKLLRDKNFYNFTFGGGTALAARYNHRNSKDVDIFLPDAQILTYLTPRLNADAENVSDNYSEASNFIKLNIGEQEIDFILAPNITGVAPKKMVFEHIDVYVDAPEEIIAKKLLYRAESLKVRDIYDTAVVLANGVELASHCAVFMAKIPAIEKRIEDIALQYTDELGRLDLINPEKYPKSLNVFQAFISECKSKFPFPKYPSV